MDRQRLLAYPPVDCGAAQSTAAGATSDSDKLLVTWMGHASFLVQVDGVNILTDPVWSERANIVQFAGPKRFVAAPVPLLDLPRIDVVTISHNHYDHLDTATVLELYRLFRPVFVVPLGMKSRWFASLGWPAADLAALVVELGWYQTTELLVAAAPQGGASPASPVMRTATQQVEGDVVAAEMLHGSAAAHAENGDGQLAAPPATSQLPATVRITAVPVQHWTMRNGLDRNMELWCGFVVEQFVASNISSSESGAAPPPLLRCRWFHDGDTGFDDRVFKQIGAEFGATPDQQVHVSAAPVAATAAAAAAAVAATEPTSEPVAPAAPPAPRPHIAQPAFDLALIPIGAYNPRWMMSQQHVDPDEAVKIYVDLGCPRLAVGMHWGTFILTDEPIDEPPQLLAAARKKYSVPDDAFVASKHGETLTVPLRKI